MSVMEGDVPECHLRSPLVESISLSSVQHDALNVTVEVGAPLDISAGLPVVLPNSNTSISLSVSHGGQPVKNAEVVVFGGEERQSPQIILHNDDTVIKQLLIPKSQDALLRTNFAPLSKHAIL